MYVRPLETGGEESAKCTGGQEDSQMKVLRCDVLPGRGAVSMLLHIGLT